MAARVGDGLGVSARARTQVPKLELSGWRLGKNKTQTWRVTERGGGGRGSWEGGDLSWKLGVPVDLENFTHQYIPPPTPRGAGNMEKDG